MSPEFDMTDITSVEERALNQNVRSASEKKGTLLQKARTILRGKGRDANPYAHVVESVQVAPEPKNISYASTFVEFAAPAAIPFMLGHLDNADKPMVQEYQKSVDVPSVVCFEMDSSGNLICNNQFEAVDVAVNGDVVGTVVRRARQVVTGNVTDGGQPTGGVQSIGTETPTGREQEQNKGFFPLLTAELNVPLKSVSELKAMSPEEQSQYIADIQDALFVEDGLIEKYADIVRITLLPTLPDSVSEADFVNALQIKVFFAERDGKTVATAVLFLDQNHNEQPENYFLKSSDPLEYNGATTDVYAGIPNEGANVSVGQVNATGDIVIVERTPKSDIVYVVGGAINQTGRASMIPMPATEVTERNGFVLTVQLAANPTGGVPDELAKVELDGVPLTQDAEISNIGDTLPVVEFDNINDPHTMTVNGETYMLGSSLVLSDPLGLGVPNNEFSHPNIFNAAEKGYGEVIPGAPGIAVVGYYVDTGTTQVTISNANSQEYTVTANYIDVAVPQASGVKLIRSLSVVGDIVAITDDGRDFTGGTSSEVFLGADMTPGQMIMVSFPYEVSENDRPWLADQYISFGYSSQTAEQIVDSWITLSPKANSVLDNQQVSIVGPVSIVGAN